MPRTLESHAATLMPYDEATHCDNEWDELWQACVAVLDRYPHIRPMPAWSPMLRHVRIPQAAVEVADVHYHLD
jgi:hypothetical protein